MSIVNIELAWIWHTFCFGVGYFKKDHACIVSIGFLNIIVIMKHNVNNNNS